MRSRLQRARTWGETALSPPHRAFQTGCNERRHGKGSVSVLRTHDAGTQNDVGERRRSRLDGSCNRRFLIQQASPLRQALRPSCGGCAASSPQQALRLRPSRPLLCACAQALPRRRLPTSWCACASERLRPPRPRPLPRPTCGARATSPHLRLRWKRRPSCACALRAPLLPQARQTQ